MDNLEKYFKESLEGFDEISPTPALWNRISKTMFFKSSGFKAGLWFLPLIILLISGFFFYNSDSGNQNNNVVVKGQINGKASKTIMNVANNSNSGIANEHNTSPAEIADKNAETPMISESDKTSTNTSSGSSASYNYPQNISSNSSSSNELTSNNVSQISVSERKPSGNNIAAPVSQSSDKYSTASVTLPVLSQPMKADKYNADPDKIVADDSRSLPVLSSADLEIPAYPAAMRDDTPLRMPLSDDEELIDKQTNTPVYSWSIPPVFKNKFEVFAGPQISFGYNSATSEKYNSYSAMLKDGQKPLIAYHFGLNYRTYYKKWFFSIGVNYYQYRDRTGYTYNSIMIDSAVTDYMIFNKTYNYVTTGYITDPNDTTKLIPVIKVEVLQDTTFVRNTYYDSTKSSLNRNFTNVYSYIEIPFSIGREFDIDKFVIDVSTGFSWGRLIKYNAVIPSPLNNDLLDLSKDNVLKTNIYNGFVNVGFGYKFNRNDVVFIRPGISYNLNSIFENDFAVSRHYLTVRLSAGIRLKF